MSQLTSIDFEAVPESNKYENKEIEKNENFKDSYAGGGSDQTVSEINGEQRY